MDYKLQNLFHRLSNGENLNIKSQLLVLEIKKQINTKKIKACEMLLDALEAEENIKNDESIK